MTEILVPVKNASQTLVSSDASFKGNNCAEMVSGTRIIGNNPCHVSLQIPNDNESSIHGDFANNYTMTFIRADDIKKPFHDGMSISGFMFSKGGIETNTDALTNDELIIVLPTATQRLNVKRMLATFGTFNGTFVMPAGILKFSAELSGNFYEPEQNFGG
jgi:hypothetical protein